MRKVILAILLLLWAAFVGAQTQAPYTHPGKVQIRSTATDALTVAGSTKTTGLSVGTAAPPAGGLVINGGTIVAEGAAIGSLAGLTINGSIASPDWTQLAFGDGTGYRLNVGTRSGGNFSTRLQIYDTGSTRFADGSTGAPSISFINASTTGLSKAGTGFFLNVGGNAVAQVFSTSFGLLDRALGSGASGPYLIIGRNSTGTGAPGVLYFGDKTAFNWSLWFDSTGVLRTNTTTIPVEGGSDTIGTVVGTQTSSRASKNILGQVNGYAPLAMDVIRRTPIWAFTYKSGAFNGETFYGITTDDSPLFGMDAGKSFNPVTAFGATVLALQDVDRRVRDLETKLAAAMATIEALQKREHRQ